MLSADSKKSNWTFYHEEEGTTDPRNVGKRLLEAVNHNCHLSTTLIAIYMTQVFLDFEDILVLLLKKDQAMPVE